MLVSPFRRASASSLVQMPVTTQPVFVSMANERTRLLNMISYLARALAVANYVDVVKGEAAGDQWASAFRDGAESAAARGDVMYVQTMADNVSDMAKAYSTAEARAIAMALALALRSYAGKVGS